MTSPFESVFLQNSDSIDLKSQLHHLEAPIPRIPSERTVICRNVPRTRIYVCTRCLLNHSFDEDLQFNQCINPPRSELVKAIRLGILLIHRHGWHLPKLENCLNLISRYAQPTTRALLLLVFSICTPLCTIILLFDEPLITADLFNSCHSSTWSVSFAQQRLTMSVSTSLNFELKTMHSN